MSNIEFKEFYRRNLPHFQTQGAMIFVTTRLAGSLPQQALWRLAEEQRQREQEAQQIADPLQKRRAAYDNEKRHLGALDALLDAAAAGPLWLAETAVAQMVYDSMLYRNGRVYDLHACTVMPNHIHLLFTPLAKAEAEDYSLAAIMMSLKSWTAAQANGLLGRQGQFWQHESYDHLVRDEREWRNIVRYILDNPVRAGLAASWDAFPWTYLKDA